MRLPLLFLLTPLALTGAVPAQNNGAHYSIVQGSDGKTVGSTQCSFVPVAGGYQVTSSGDLHLQKFSYAFTDNNRLDSQLNLVRAEVSGTVNGSQAVFSIASDPS